MDVQNAGQKQSNDKNVEREKLKINIDADPFNGIATTKYVTSSDLCKMASDIFRSVFADAEGATFDIVGNVPTLAAIFNHGVYDKDATVACTREASVDANASIMARVRSRDRLLNNGDRFFITEDGKDVFTDLLSYQAFANNKPNWSKVVVEFSENTQQRFYGYGQAPQYTKIGYLDLAKFAALVWGSEVDGDPVDYVVTIVRALNSGVPGMPPTNYMLSVTQISSKELQATYEKLGFGSFSSIIR